VLSSEFEGKGSFSFNSGGSFSQHTTYTLFDTLAAAKAAFDAKLFIEATQLLVSLHYT
jgi:hypothetical protein